VIISLKEFKSWVMYISFALLYGKTELSTNNWFNPDTCLCLSQARTWISTSYVMVFCVFNEF
jgi:hypothetical protein